MANSQSESSLFPFFKIKRDSVSTHSAERSPRGVMKLDGWILRGKENNA